MYLSTLGNFLRVKRVLEDETLRSASSHLECTPTFLCYVEQGVRSMPDKWRDVLPDFYNMTQSEIFEFNCLADKAQGFVKIDCAGSDIKQIGFIQQFKDALPRLDDKDICAIEEILNNA
mgnify:CR=1 FL=1